jgi:regulator of protease activity HflC (stomatin/prohibitin superfamily)
MLIILFFCGLAFCALVAALVANIPRLGRQALAVTAPLLVIFGVLVGSSVVIPTDQTGVVTRLVGSALPAGNIVARGGEQGPQAEILGPGWHFGYVPFLFQIDLAPVQIIPPGKLGFVTALDGKPLPTDETYAPPWSSAADMLDPITFLSKDGCRGPQTTVLTPGTYRYNPRLHQIHAIDALVVAPGTVAVIKSNSGNLVSSGADIILVNGTPLVNRESRGIWREPLAPGAYYLNTIAYQPTVVKTTQRVYVYQQQQQHQANNKTSAAQGEDWSVTVRSKDGFSFPVDVRVTCAVDSKDAPYLVALLGDPDKMMRDEQENTELEIMEAKVILPAVRAIFRNVAETMNALEFVNARSIVERTATERMQIELKKFRVTCDGVYVGNIHLDSSEAGRKLLTTQTDREVAVNQQQLYAEQKKAEVARSEYVKAQEEAEQQRNLAQATYQVKVKEQGALARAAEAKGESEYQIITGEGRAKAYEAMVRALGKEQVAQLELLKLVSEGRIQITPQVMMVGQGSPVDALAGTMLRQAIPVTTPATTPAAPSTGGKP